MRFLVVLLALALIVPAALAVTLQSVYDAAGAGEGYDKLLILDPNETYTGGCGVEIGKKSCIRGNGAVCDLMNSQVDVSLAGTTLDITGCCLINGGSYGAIYVSRGGSANIDGNTICKNRIGIYVWESSSATVKNNIVFKNTKASGSMYGVAKHQSTSSLSCLYNDVDSNTGGNYVYFCPG